MEAFVPKGQGGADRVLEQGAHPRALSCPSKVSVQISWAGLGSEQSLESCFCPSLLLGIQSQSLWAGLWSVLSKRSKIETRRGHVACLKGHVTLL